MAAALFFMAPAQLGPCDYVNVNGHCRPSPDHNPSNLHDSDGTNPQPALPTTNFLSYEPLTHN
jgi:hypothetical protein